MKGELKVPGPLMPAYHQFDGMAVEVQTGTGGFAPPTLRFPVMPDLRHTRAEALYYGGWADSVQGSLFLARQDLEFRLTHMREYDDTLVYELQLPRIVD